MKQNISFALRLGLVASLFTLGSLATACGDDGGATADAGPMIDAGRPDATAPCAEATQHSDFAWINANIFTKSCAFSGCHNTASHEESLDLTSTAAFAEIVGVSSTQVASKKLIDSTSTDCTNSYLYDKLAGQNMKTGTVVMPRAQPMLCQEKIDAVCRWIAAGAHND
jgi:hypothetical protein